MKEAQSEVCPDKESSVESIVGSEAATSAHVTVMARDLFLSCLGLSLLLQARPQLVLNSFNGDAAQASLQLSRWTAYAAMLEFFVSPTLGKLSDAFGRKPFMLVSPALNMVMRAAVASSPSPWLVGLDKVSTSCLLAAGGVATSAAVSDIARGRQLAMCNAKIGISAGAAFVFGPACAGILIKRKGPRAAYALSAAIAALQVLLLQRSLKETLPLEQRRPAPGFVSPFSFLRLLTAGSPALRSLTIVGLLQAFCEPKTWNDMVQLYMRVNVGLPAEKVGRFFAAFGVAAICAKAWTRLAIGKYGASFHTSVSNGATALAFFAWGAAPSSLWTSVAAPLALAPFFLDHRAGINSRTNDLAVAAGFGKGESAAMFANFRALAVTIAPLLFGRAYSYGNAKSVQLPGLGFWLAGIIVLFAEGVHRSSGTVLEQPESSQTPEIGSKKD